ncbi:MAG: MCP four helix bundle domain-containing protein, partial [Pseudomonadota bacterium]
MRNFGFSRKIYFGFGLLILAIGIVGLFGSQSVKGVSGLFSDFRQAASQNLLLASIQEDLMAVRLNEFKYRVAADLEAANGVRDGIAQIADEQERIEEIVSDPALRQILEQITNTLIQYEETFSSVEALEFSRSRGLKAISDATAEIAEIMRAIGDSDVAESMAVVDAAIVRFDQDRQATDLEAAIGRIDTAISTVDNMLILLADATRRGQAEATVASLGSLKEKISALDAILVERDQLYNQIDILGPATARLLDDGLQASFESQNRSGDEATG